MAKRTNSPRPKKASVASRQTAEYRHPEETPARPDVGVQPQFKKRAAPRTYRYDSSLAPALDWDGQNPAREQGEALIAELERRIAALRSRSAKLASRSNLPSPSGRGAGGEGELLAELQGAEEALRKLKALSKVVRSHVNFMVPDTKRWEQSAAYLIDTHPATRAFVKNAGLGFAIPYIHNGQTHEYIPDFIIQLKSDSSRDLVAETKGFDELEEVKREAAERWVRAVNAEGSFGRWH